MRHALPLCLLVLLGCLAMIVTAQDFIAPLPQPTAALQPQPAQTLIAPDSSEITIELMFDTLKQGRAGWVRIPGDQITHVEGRAFNRAVRFFRHTNAWYGLLVAEIDRSPREYPLDLTIVVNDQTFRYTVLIRVTNGGFIRQDVFIPDVEELIEESVEQEELRQIFTLAADYTQSPLWDEGGFMPPLNTELTSPFGAVRVFNGTYNTLHTGWDFQADTGQPIQATADGRVVFAGTLPIRGQYVLIDHGRGIFSGYAHQSVIYVTQGQFVHRGQVVGLVGSTGRSSSPHGHVEFIADGQWIDPVDFILMGVPLQPSPSQN